MSGIEVAPYGPEQRQAALDLLLAFFAEEGMAAAGDFGQRFDRFAGDERNGVLLAFKDGEPLGVITVTTTFGLEFGVSAELEDLYVRPAARGQGIATALLDAARSWCAAHDAGTIFLVVLPGADEALIRFYRGRGFAERGRRLLFYEGESSGSW